MASTLIEYLEISANRNPDRIAVVGPNGSITFGELKVKSDALARYFFSRGMRKGDRVGVVLAKDIPAVISFFGIMKAGAAYVPLDFNAPLERISQILDNCKVKGVIADRRALAEISKTLNDGVMTIAVGDRQQSDELSPVYFNEVIGNGTQAALPLVGAQDLAYVLHTSGSTGTPKGVMITHGNATSFVDWCSSEFQPTSKDRFSSHAPFHFDLSIFDLYLSIKHRATVFLISEDVAKNPKELVRFISENQLSIFYSTPSTLRMLLQFGHLNQHDFSSLRLVLFAGEVFPVKYLRALKEAWPKPDYYNLYGPTETNVCTFARIPGTIPANREQPYPIGFVCPHCKALVLDEAGKEVATGSEGMLYISGESVFAGYWNKPEETARGFLERDGVKWYNTGDVVREDPGDGYIYVGRNDRMVKRRGYRIELNEIEQALYSHPLINEAAVVSIPDAEAGVKILAFISSSNQEGLSIIELKTFCSAKLPVYMSPDKFLVQPSLPKTSTNKIDYQSLKKTLHKDN